MRIAALALNVALMLGCEHDEHPFEVPWSASCTAVDTPGMVAVFDRDFWEDDAGNRRRYIAEVRLPLDSELYDAWIWDVRINLRDQSAETLALEHVPIPDSFATTYNLRPLGLEVESYVEDPEGGWAEMEGTCSWGQSRGDLFLNQLDDCDACITCSSTGSPVGAWPLVLLGLGLIRRKRAASLHA